MKNISIIIILLALIITVACDKTNPKECISRKDFAWIAIQPFEDFDTKLADTAARHIAQAYGIKTEVLPPLPLPENAFTNIRVHRYRADSLIRYLTYTKPQHATIVLGLTNKDISVTKRDSTGQIKYPASKYIDFGVFGLGFCPGPACVVSIYRYKNSAQFYDRFFKICKHEVGHNLGLPHCINKTCVMQDAAESIKTIDNAGEFLCERCTYRLRATLEPMVLHN